MMRIRAEQRGQCLERIGDQIDRDQVHEVHQENPDEDGQRQGRDQGVLTAEGAADIVFHEVDDPFHEVLRPARLPGRDLARNPFEEPEKQAAEQDREEHGVDVNGPEAHFRRLFRGGREGQPLLRMIPEGEVGQMVLDVPLGRERFGRGHRSSLA